VEILLKQSYRTGIFIKISTAEKPKYARFSSFIFFQRNYDFSELFNDALAGLSRLIIS